MMIIDCYNILKKIEPRPAMWTGENTLKSIGIFLTGYYSALLENNLIGNSNSEESFHNWVADKLGFYESTAGWGNMILAVTIGLNPKKISWENFDSEVDKNQHEMSIRKFYELLEEFISNKNI